MKIAILGLGTIGYGVYDLIVHSHLDIQVVKIWDRVHREECRDLYATSLDDIMNDSKIEVIVETMGTEAVYPIVKTAIEHKKSVVTANKDLIGRYLPELTALKEQHGVSLYYEASVGGGIPIIKPLYRLSQTHNIIEIEGILNGTTNFIITKMEEGLEFEDALKEAKRLGFAENDPTNDIQGFDPMRKIAILGMIVFKKHIPYHTIPHYGLENITQKDLRYFARMNQCIKMIAYINHDEAYVMPTAYPKNSLFAQTKDEFNAITIKAEHYDTLTFVGRGAGRYPTASAIVDDLISISNKEINYTFRNEGEMTFKNPITSYYLRVREPLQVDPAIIAHRHGSVIITTPIDITTLNLSNVLFYVRIRKEDCYV